MYWEIDLIERILKISCMFIVLTLFMCCNKPYDSVKYCKQKTDNPPPATNVRFYPDGCGFSTINHAV